MYIIAICSNDDSCFFQLDKLISSYQTHCKAKTGKKNWLIK